MNVGKEVFSLVLEVDLRRLRRRARLIRLVVVFELELASVSLELELEEPLDELEEFKISAKTPGYWDSSSIRC